MNTSNDAWGPDERPPRSQDSTILLLDMCDGNKGAADELAPLVYEELRVTARRLLRNERAGHTLQATALVNEVYLRMINQERVNWQGKAHFCAIAANFMRRILCNHARERRARKRGGNAQRVDISDIQIAGNDFRGVDLLELDDILGRLSELNPRHAQIVEMRYFCGLTVDETAHALDLSPTTVKNEWRTARAWIRSQYCD